jgi:tetratricopeptide (TPR) repeat protein
LVREEKMRTKNRIVHSLLVAVILGACAVPHHPQPELGVQQVQPGSLLTDSPLARGVSLPDVSSTRILEVTPEMQAFLEERIDDRTMENTKVRQLLSMLAIDGQFDLVYDDQTRTAAETFRDRRGNCLSFTNMFVAMARHVGLDAHFQEVEIPPDWSSVGDTLLLSQHINVLVDMRHYVDRVVDFNTDVIHYFIHDLKANYERRVISDQRARAHYFNNIGVERMLTGGDTPDVLAYLLQSIREDETFAPGWISLGILHRRDGYFDHAEAAYLQALSIDDTNLVAMSNLASLYQMAGQTDRAESYRALVQEHRMKNPYYRFYLAQEAVIKGDYPAAVDHLEFAIKKNESEHRFYFLMGVSYLLLGREGEARSWLSQAETLAEEQGDRQRYRHKLDWLMSHAVER